MMIATLSATNEIRPIANVGVEEVWWDAGNKFLRIHLNRLRMDVPSIETIDGELIPTEKARKQSKRLFLFGFAFLPLLWFCNVWLFWHDFMGRPGADPEIKRRE